MTGYIIRRILWMIPLLWAIVTITFLLMHNVEGGPFSRERELPPSVMENLNRKYNLDKPVVDWQIWDSQYGIYIWKLLHGDLGVSFRSANQPVAELIKEGFGVSAQLGLLAFVFAVVFGVSLGTVSALNQNGPLDYAGVFFATAGAAMPNFILATFLIIIFAVQLGWFDVLGWGGPGWGEFYNPSAS